MSCTFGSEPFEPADELDDDEGWLDLAMAELEEQRLLDEDDADDLVTDSDLELDLDSDLELDDEKVSDFEVEDGSGEAVFATASATASANLPSIPSVSSASPFPWLAAAGSDDEDAFVDEDD